MSRATICGFEGNHKPPRDDKWVCPKCGISGEALNRIEDIAAKIRGAAPSGAPEGRGG